MANYFINREFDILHLLNLQINLNELFFLINSSNMLYTYNSKSISYKLYCEIAVDNANLLRISNFDIFSVLNGKIKKYFSKEIQVKLDSEIIDKLRRSEIIGLNYHLSLQSIHYIEFLIIDEMDFKELFNLISAVIKYEFDHIYYNLEEMIDKLELLIFEEKTNNVTSDLNYLKMKYENILNFLIDLAEINEKYKLIISCIKMIQRFYSNTKKCFKAYRISNCEVPLKKYQYYSNESISNMASIQSELNHGDLVNDLILYENKYDFISVNVNIEVNCNIMLFVIDEFFHFKRIKIVKTGIYNIYWPDSIFIGCNEYQEIDYIN